MNPKSIILTLICFLSICGRLHGHADSFKILSEFIDRNSNLETDDVTGEKLSTKNDATINRGKVNDVTANGEEESKGLVLETPTEPKVENEKEIKSPKVNINIVHDITSSGDNEAAQHETEVHEIVDDVTFSRIRLPKFDDVKVNQTFTTVLPGDIEAEVKVLSLSPFIFGE